MSATDRDRDRHAPVVEQVTDLGGHHRLIEARDPDGSVSYWLHDGEPTSSPRPRPWPPVHEATGPLPATIRDLIHPPLLCGRPTRAGNPCRARDPGDGSGCLHHRATEVRR